MRSVGPSVATRCESAASLACRARMARGTGSLLTPDAQMSSTGYPLAPSYRCVEPGGKRLVTHGARSIPLGPEQQHAAIVPLGPIAHRDLRPRVILDFREVPSLNHVALSTLEDHVVEIHHGVAVGD